MPLNSLTQCYNNTCYHNCLSTPSIVRSTPSTINAARMMLQERFKGLQWVQRPVSLEPRWTVEPDLESIKRTIEEARPLQEVSVSFLAQGAFNKIYDIQAGNQDLVM